MGCYLAQWPRLLGRIVVPPWPNVPRARLRAREDTWGRGVMEPLEEADGSGARRSVVTPSRANPIPRALRIPTGLITGQSIA